ncbi:MAG TPA: FMN-binding negative transcriptional regulator, partial [Stellaceae bacterium]
MYLPRDFKEERVPVLHDAIRQARLGTLVTLGADGIEASHVPMIIDAEPQPFGTLRGHVARANPQWRRVTAGVQALAMFLGPDAYITPSWYETKQQSGKVVPTWNYVAIHAYGTLEFYDDPDRLLGLVTRLTETHEGGRAEPWAVSDAPRDYIAGMLKAIVGFEL